MEGIEFYMTSGDTKIVTMPVLLNNGERKDLTGASGEFALVLHRDSKEYKAIILRDIEITDAENGMIKFTVLPQDTEGCNGYYAFDVKITKSGQTKTVKRGWILIYPSCIDRRV